MLIKMQKNQFRLQSKYFPIRGKGQSLPVCVAIEAEWREKMKVCPQLSEKKCLLLLSGWASQGRMARNATMI